MLLFIAYDRESRRLAVGSNSKQVKVVEFAKNNDSTSDSDHIVLKDDGISDDTINEERNNKSQTSNSQENMFFEVKNRYSFCDHSQRVLAVILIKSGKYLVTTGSDGLVNLYEIVSSSLLKSLSFNILLQQRVEVCSLAMNRSNGGLLIGTVGWSLYQWDIKQILEQHEKIQENDISCVDNSEKVRISQNPKPDWFNFDENRKPRKTAPVQQVQIARGPNVHRSETSSIGSDRRGVSTHCNSLTSTPQKPKTTKPLKTDDEKFLGIFDSSKRDFSNFDRLYKDLIQIWHSKSKLKFVESDFLKSRKNAFRTCAEILAQNDSNKRQMSVDADIDQENNYEYEITSSINAILGIANPTNIQSPTESDLINSLLLNSTPRCLLGNNLVLDSYLKHGATFRRKIEILLYAGEYERVVSDLIEAKLYKEAVLIERCWIRENSAANSAENMQNEDIKNKSRKSALELWSEILLKTGMYEQAARIFSILGNKTDALKALDKRQSSFNKTTKTMGIPSLTCLLVKLSLQDKFCKTSFMTIFGFVSELNSDDAKILTNKVIGYYEDCEIEISPVLEVFCFFLGKVAFKNEKCEKVNAGGESMNKSQEVMDMSKKAKSIIKNDVDFCNSTGIFEKLQKIIIEVRTS